MAKPEAPTLETSRLLLRRKRTEDIPPMLRMYNMEEVRRFLGGYPPRDEHSMLKLVRARQKSEWSVTLRDTGEYLGECLLTKIVDGYMGELGYLFLREHWGKGYAGEAVRAVMAHSRDTLGLRRLYIVTDDRNERSKRLAERVGFRLVARLPEYDFGGRIADVAYYTCLLDEDATQ